MKFINSARRAVVILSRPDCFFSEVVHCLNIQQSPAYSMDVNSLLDCSIWRVWIAISAVVWVVSVNM